MNKEEILNKIIEDKITFAVMKAIKHYGLEYSEEVIRKVYKYLPTTRKILLNELYYIWYNKTKRITSK